MFGYEIGVFDKYSKLSSYKFWVLGIQAKKFFSYNAYVLFIENEKEFNSDKSVAFFDMKFWVFKSFAVE